MAEEEAGATLSQLFDTDPAELSANRGEGFRAICRKLRDSRKQFNRHAAQAATNAKSKKSNGPHIEINLDDLDL